MLSVCRTVARLFVLILLGLYGVIGCASPTRVNDTTAQADLRAHIEALNEAMEARFRAGDMLDVAAFYADDGIMLAPDGERVEGRNAIDAYWARTGENYTDLDWELTVEHVEGDEGLAYQRGRSTLSRTSVDGERRVSIVEFVLIWQQQDDGSYRILVDAYW